MYDACGETPECLLPTKDTWLLNKSVFRRRSKELKYKTKKSFVLEMKVFSYMMCACVRESVRARDIGMTCKNAYVVAQCVYND